MTKQMNKNQTSKKLDLRYSRQGNGFIWVELVDSEDREYHAILDGVALKEHDEDPLVTVLEWMIVLMPLVCFIALLALVLKSIIES